LNRTSLKEQLNLVKQKIKLIRIGMIKHELLTNVALKILTINCSLFTEK
jgi:hypothetical protein